MKTVKHILFNKSLVLIFAVILYSSLNGCNDDLFPETVTIERTVSAAWSADNQDILKVISTYETKKPDEIYYNATSAKNWNFRFEICNPDLTARSTFGHYRDNDMGGRLYAVYWLPKVNKILTSFPNQFAMLINMDGTEKILKTPDEVLIAILGSTQIWLGAWNYAPSPNEEIIAVYYFVDSGELLNLTYKHCISFFDVKTGNHIFSQEIPFPKIKPELWTGIPDYEDRRSFLWAKDGSGVFFVTRDQSYFVRYGGNKGIESVNLVPELGLITNSGPVSNDGKYLDIIIDGNQTGLQIKQIDNWKPFSDLKLIPASENTYSFY